MELTLIILVGCYVLLAAIVVFFLYNLFLGGYPKAPLNMLTMKLISEKVYYLYTKKNYLSVKRINKILVDIERTLMHLWGCYGDKKNKWEECYKYLYKINFEKGLTNRTDCKKTIDKVYDLICF